MRIMSNIQYQDLHSKCKLRTKECQLNLKQNLELWQGGEHRMI